MTQCRGGSPTCGVKHGSQRVYTRLLKAGNAWVTIKYGSGDGGGGGVYEIKRHLLTRGLIIDIRDIRDRTGRECVCGGGRFHSPPTRQGRTGSGVSRSVTVSVGSHDSSSAGSGSDPVGDQCVR